MQRKAFWLVITALLICLLNLSSITAIDIPTDPCYAPTVVYQNSTHFRMTGGCFIVDFPKNASQLISFFDSYNNKSFALKIYSLKDVNIGNPNQARNYAFEDVTATASSDGRSVAYTIMGGKATARYSIEGNKVKAGLEMSNFTSYYPTGKLELRTRIMKDPLASAHFINLPSVVDGIEQPLDVVNETSGVNQFFVQTLFTGSSFASLIIDPIYTVDYSPIPAQWLQQGNVTASLDSNFLNNTDITVGVSDNSTATQYSTNSYSLNPQSYTYYDEAPTNDTSLVVSIDGSYSDTQLDYNSGKYGRVLLSSGKFYNGSKVNLYFKPRDAADISVIITNSANTVNYSTEFFTGIDTVNFHWENLTLFNLPASESNLYIHETNLGDNRRIYIDYLQLLNRNYNNGSAISGKWAETYDPAYQYFLRVYKTTSGADMLYIYAYNSTNSISTQSVSTSAITGTGWFNINVTSLVQYMTSTLGLNYTAFRWWTDTSQSFSEEWLRAETNDTTSPTVSACTTNASSLGCGGSAFLQCNVTDNIEVSTVTFQINAVNSSTTKNIDQYYSTLSPVGATTSAGVIYDWESVYATDILANLATYDPNISINYTCCTPDWQAYYGICQINDTQLKYYLDSNSCGTTDGLPVDNGTETYCDYCTEDLQKHYNDECNLTGQRTFEWDDHAFYGCCLITSIISDCSILYSPYNETGVENCTAVYHDFAIDLDTQLFFGMGIGGLASDKAFGKIWLNDTNNTYTCLTYVKTVEGQIIQTNPPYTKRTEATVALTQKEIEDREFFITQSGLANVYWTDHNLVIDGRQYIFGVECAGNSQRLISEQVSTVGYKPLNSPITRWFWAQENVVPLVLGFLLFIIIVFAIGFLFWIFKKAR
jgi:hypothetical protein